MSQTAASEMVRLYEHGKLIFFKARTPLHVGVGRTYGEAVDLPVQRDEHGLPVIWASSVKGALRASKYLLFRGERVDRCLDYVYGPSEPSEESQFASSISILDARLLIMPVRSLRGVYAYATSPMLLEYLKTYLDILISCCGDSDRLSNLCREISNLVNSVGRSLDGACALVSSSSRRNLSVNNVLILNECFIGNVKELERDSVNIINNLSSIIFRSSELIERIVILRDDILMRLVNKSMIVVNRVKLDYETKTVKTGPWSEEYVPRGSVFVSAVMYSRPRFCIGNDFSELRRKANEACMKVLERRACRDICDRSCDIWSIFIDPGKYMILGGHETIGKGIVEVVTI
ncbi:MAG: type III-B CRISPR module RAMP protein Cmr4 [Crenarchaeota archaeon]|nr:type III-B CRISPR module RAMP protein Cmr4 [Thermoproteota archaeon]